MFKDLLKMITYRPDDAPSMNKALGSALDGLAPGQALHLTRASDGEEFIIMAADDFQHIAGLAGLRAKDVEQQ